MASYQSSSYSSSYSSSSSSSSSALKIWSRRGKMQNLPPPAEETPYDRVKAYLEDFRRSRQGQKTVAPRDFEQVFRCQISEKDWFKLREDLHLDDDERDRCKYSYNPSTSILLIRCTTTEVHDGLVNFLTTSLMDARPEGVRVTSSQHTRPLRGELEGTDKKADLAIYQRLDEGFYRPWKLKWVLEVGFTETYEELLEDIRQWLLGGAGESKYGVLMKIIEDPTYRCPLSNISDEELEGRDLKDSHDVDVEDFVMEEEFGPVSYQGDRWAGKIKEIFWEVWQWNPESRQPELVGEREVIVPKTDSSPRVQFSEFLEGAPENAQASLDWDMYRSLLKTDIAQMACFRYSRWQVERKMKAGDDMRRDPTYVAE